MKPCQSFQCPVEATLQLIGGKYKSLILWHLIGKTLRFNELGKGGVEVGAVLFKVGFPQPPVMPDILATHSI